MLWENNMNLEPTGGMPQEQPQMMPPQEMPMEQPMPEQGGMPAQEKDGVTGVSVDEQIAVAQELLASDPQAEDEALTLLEDSGLSQIEMERAGVMAAWAIETPESYPEILAAMTALFPQVQSIFSGEINQDGEKLSGLVLAATAMEGGQI